MRDDLEAEAYVEQAKKLVIAIRSLKSEYGVASNERPVVFIFGPPLPQRMYAEISHLAKCDLRHAR